MGKPQTRKRNKLEGKLPKPLVLGVIVSHGRLLWSRLRRYWRFIVVSEGVCEIMSSRCWKGDFNDQSRDVASRFPSTVASPTSGLRFSSFRQILTLERHTTNRRHVMMQHLRWLMAPRARSMHPVPEVSVLTTPYRHRPR